MFDLCITDMWLIESLVAIEKKLTDNSCIDSILRSFLLIRVQNFFIERQKQLVSFLRNKILQFSIEKSMR